VCRTSLASPDLKGDEAPMTATVRILLADDHALLRAGIRALLNNLPGVEVVAEAGNGLDALAAVEHYRPDIVFSDIAMPMMNGLELATRLSRDFPMIKTIILSIHAEEEYICRALQAGAVGYLLKDSCPAELSLAIQAVSRGDSYLSPAISNQVISDYTRRTGTDARAPGLLSPRQREILRLIAIGQTTKAIARTLGISVKTVETHRAQLMDRLEIYEIAGLVRYAIRTGLATLDE
jgi:DNA-binding NarL/FixJ family response regulator